MAGAAGARTTVWGAGGAGAAPRPDSRTSISSDLALTRVATLSLLRLVVTEAYVSTTWPSRFTRSRKTSVGGSSPSTGATSTLISPLTPGRGRTA